jgi:hypothetical protein
MSIPDLHPFEFALEVTSVLPTSEGHKFNDDLLANDGDIQEARKQWETIIHVLNHRELQKYFHQFNGRADNAKSKSLKWGTIAILLGAIAVLLAATEINLQQYERPLTEQIGDWANLVQWAIAVVAALSGIASVTIGKMGILFGRRKSQWLHNRFMGERIRQFHFQTFIARLPEIVASLEGETAKTKFESMRSEWFAAFQADFDGKVNGAFEDAIQTANDGWLHDARVHDDIVDHKELEPLFDAYRKLRIKHQLGYANYKLQDDYRIFSVMPCRQALILESITTWGIGTLLFIHIFLFITIIFVGLSLSHNNSFSSVFSPVSSPFNAAIVIIAVLSLAARAFEQGLQPEREIERYRRYRSNVQSILNRFDNATTQSQKISVMREMELLSFHEMRDFLLTNKNATFVM